MERFLKMVTFGYHEWTVEMIETDETCLYYIDMCPCDDMYNYKEAAFYPQFVKLATPHFDTEEADTIQVATPFGWAIVAKWFNNGSTRIYGLKPEVVMEAVLILGGPCDSGFCTPANGEYYVCSETLDNEHDERVFLGHNIADEYEAKCCALFNP